MRTTVLLSAILPLLWIGTAQAAKLSGDWNGNGIAFDAEDVKFFRYIFTRNVNPDITGDGKVTQEDFALWKIELQNSVPE